MDTRPVDLVEVVRLEDVSAHNAGAVGGFQLDIDMAEEDVEIALDGGCIALLRDGELCTKGSAFNRASRGVPLGKGRRSGAEVGFELPFGQAGVRRAGLCRQKQSV